MNSSQTRQQGSTAAVILCGGRSRRMGSPKYALPFGETTLLEHMLGILSRTTQRVAVIAAPDDSPTVPSDVTLLRDRLRHAGPLAATEIALGHFAHVDWVLVTACDLPLLRSEVIEGLFHHAATARTCEAVVPKPGQYPEPLLAVYRPQLAESARRLLEAGERRLQALLQQATCLFLDAEELRSLDPHLESFRNINTPEQYQEALMRYRERSPRKR